EQGPVLQMRHLHETGHRRVAFVGATDPRIADLVAARRRQANAANQVLGFEMAGTRDIDLTEESAAEAVAALVADGVTGVAAYNDDVALALVGAAIRSGVAVPGELAVVGHDDAHFAAPHQPRLTTTRLDDPG